MERIDGRKNNQLRPIFLERHFQMHPAGSAIIEMGNTKVICSAMVEDRVPYFLKGKSCGWVTAEYSMLPGSAAIRVARDREGRINGRSMEIQRLIGRALRTVVDLESLGERTITVDCDVLQSDGGTRTAAITGAFVALVEACTTIYEEGKIFPVKDFVAAVSAGISPECEALLDLNYKEDFETLADCNVVMTGAGEFVEIQITGEKKSFTREELSKILDLSEIGIRKLFEIQKDALKNLAWYVGRTN